VPSSNEWLVPAVEAADREIREASATDSTVDLGGAFAAWALQVVSDSIGWDEASEATAVGNTPGGDGGIDGWLVSEAGDELVILQAKFSSSPLSARLDPSDARDFQSAYNRVVYSDSESLSSAERDIQEAARNVREAQGRIRIILATWSQTSSETESRFAKAATRFEDDEQFELWNVWKLAEEWSKIASDDDLEGQTFTFDVRSAWLDMPNPAPPGVQQAGVTSLDAFSIADGLRPVASRAIAPNVRFHLGHRGPVNRYILQTAHNDPEKFWLLNNGLTIIADHMEVRTDQIEVRNPQIVNGGQTLFSLIRSLDGDSPLRPSTASVMARFVVLRNDQSSDDLESPGAQLKREISEGTNRQNKITAADLRSNDDVQQELAVALSKVDPPWFYERKRNSRTALTATQKRKFAGVITKDELGQRWRAFDGEPALAIKAKSKMYADDEPGTRLYGRVFDSSRDPYEYVLAHLVFESFRSRREALPRFSDELARSQNLWAAHCSALTRVALERRAPLDARHLAALALDGGLLGLVSAVESLALSWLKGRFVSAKRSKENLQVKGVMEDVDTFVEWVEYLDDETEGISEALDGILGA